MTPTRTEIIILATRTQNVLGEKGRRIRELTALVQKRFNFDENSVEVGEPLADSAHSCASSPAMPAPSLLARARSSDEKILRVTDKP